MSVGATIPGDGGPRGVSLTFAVDDGKDTRVWIYLSAAEFEDLIKRGRRMLNPDETK